MCTHFCRVLNRPDFVSVTIILCFVSFWNGHPGGKRGLGSGCIQCSYKSLQVALKIAAGLSLILGLDICITNMNICTQGKAYCKPPQCHIMRMLQNSSFKAFCHKINFLSLQDAWFEINARLTVP